MLHQGRLLSFCIFSSTILDIGGRGGCLGAPGLMLETEHADHDDVISGDNYTSYDNFTSHQYDYDYISSQEDNVTSSERSVPGGRGLFDAEDQEYDDEAVLFEEDSFKELASRINLSDNDDAEIEREERLFSFEDPENKAEVIRMAQSDINKIFNKRKFRKNKRLPKSDRKKVRECRKKDKLFSRRDKKCYHPLAEEPGPVNGL